METRAFMLRPYAVPRLADYGSLEPRTGRGNDNINENDAVNGTTNLKT